ncbi:Glutathione S-transferase U18 [Bienertia sinuspersici]
MQWFPTFHEVVHATDEETRASAIEKVKEALDLFEDAFIKCSKGKPFFSGDKIGYLDIVLGSFVGWLRVVGKINNLNLLSSEKTPNLSAWADKFCAHDAVKDIMPKTDKLIEFANLMKAKFQAAAAASQS